MYPSLKYAHVPAEVVTWPTDCEEISAASLKELIDYREKALAALKGVDNDEARSELEFTVREIGDDIAHRILKVTRSVAFLGAGWSPQSFGGDVTLRRDGSVVAVVSGHEMYDDIRPSDHQRSAEEITGSLSEFLPDQNVVAGWSDDEVAVIQWAPQDVVIKLVVDVEDWVGIETRCTEGWEARRESQPQA